MKTEKIKINLLPLDDFKEDIGLFTNNLDLARKFISKHPMFYTKEKIWWLWSKKEKLWMIVDEVDIMNELDKALKETYDTTKTQKKNEILESLKRIGRMNIPKPFKKTWIQFNDNIIDIVSDEKFESTPEYFSTNPIPHNIGKSTDTPTIDKLFEEWVGKDWVDTLYEIIAYCMLPDYPIHRIFCLNGAGLNGKGTFLRLLQRFIGYKNSCSTELDLIISSRFEVGKLYKKLVCQMGETNFSGLKQTSLLKRLTGQDLIGFEFKNKLPFDDYNYAKILIATNTLPITYDKTVGFYRRWMIIDFPNTFSEKNDVLSKISEEEYENLAKKSIKTLNRILVNREFTNEGSIEERRRHYEEASNPIKEFIKNNYELDVNEKTPLWEFREKFVSYLKQRKIRELTNREISDSIKLEGFQIEKEHYYKKDGERSTMYFIFGLKKKDVSGYVDTKDTLIPTYSLYSKEYENNISKHIHVSTCHLCGTKLDSFQEQFPLNSGKWYCSTCIKIMKKSK